MTNPPLQPASEVQAPYIRMPGIGTGLLVSSTVFLLFGALIYMGTSYSGFNLELFQTKLGIGVFLTGVMFVAIGLILAGVRSIAQQVVDTLHDADRS